MRVFFYTDLSAYGITEYIEDLMQGLSTFSQPQMLDWHELNGTCEVANFQISNATRRTLATLSVSRHNVKVATLHDICPRNVVLRRFLMPVQSALIRRSLAIIVHTDFARRFLQNMDPKVPEELIHVIPMGTKIIDISPEECRSIRKRYGFSEDDILLTVAGHLKLSKGVASTIHSWRRIRKVPNLKLVILGKPVDRETANLLNDLTDNDIIHFGFLEKKAFHELIGVTNALLNFRLDSAGETSEPLMFALGYGKPVLASSTGSSQEIIGAAGLLTEPSEQGITQCLELFVSDEGLRRRLEREAQLRREKYGWSVIAQLHKKLYLELLS